MDFLALLRAGKTLIWFFEKIPAEAAPGELVVVIVGGPRWQGLVGV